MVEEFFFVLQVLYHTLAHLIRLHDVEKVSFSEHLHSLTLQSRDLCFMLLECYSKHLSQPRRDLFEKATGLMITPVEQSTGFLTTLEAECAMEEARRQDLIQHHARSVRTSNRDGGSGGGSTGASGSGGVRSGGADGSGAVKVEPRSTVKPTATAQRAEPATTAASGKAPAPANNN